MAHAVSGVEHETPVHPLTHVQDVESSGTHRPCPEQWLELHASTAARKSFTAGPPDVFIHDQNVSLLMSELGPHTTSPSAPSSYGTRNVMAKSVGDKNVVN